MSVEPEQPAAPPARRWRHWVAVALVGAAAGAIGGAATGLGDDPPDVDAGPAVEASEVGFSHVAAQVAPAVARVDAEGPGLEGAGSAVVYDTDGLLVTNAHVVDGATDVRVTLPDGDRLDAEVVGLHPPADLALLDVELAGLPAPPWADPQHEPQVGESVAAIGSPFGLDGSVSAGIVSALDRTVRPDRQLPPLVGMVQTDAAINPGNSGGALVDATGRVIGVNTAIISTDGASAGVGFAIPAGTVHSVVEQLLEDGEVRQASLGIAARTVDAEVAGEYGLPADEGVMIVEVEDDGPAQRAGVQSGDLVVRVDDDEVATLAELVALVRLRTPGETVELGIWRDGRTLELQVELAEHEG